MNRQRMTRAFWLRLSKHVIRPEREFNGTILITLRDNDNIRIMEELIICVAPVPGETQDEKFPGALDVAEELIRCHDVGAAIGHLHVRDENLLQSVDTMLFEEDVKKIQAACPLIVEASTGGAPEHTLDQRCVSFTVPGVELGSLNLGTINMFGSVYSNPINDMRYYASKLKNKTIEPILICFDLSHFSYISRLENEGLIQSPHIFDLVFDVPDALPYKKNYLDIFLDEIPSDSNWFLVRHHANGAKDLIEALEKGGHVRVGFEDGPFLSDGSRAKSNAELVEDVAKLAHKVGRKVVSPDRAREILGIKK